MGGKKLARSAPAARINAGMSPDVRECYKSENENCELTDVVDPRARTSSLTEQQRVAIELLVRGRVDREVARQVGVHRVTVTRWRWRNADFRRALEKRRDEVWGVAGDRLLAMIEQALRVYRAELNHPEASIAHRAATALLRLADLGRLARCE